MSTNIGIAVVMPGKVELVPRAAYDPLRDITIFLAGVPIVGGLITPLPLADEPYGTARVIGDGVKFALASTGGNATAIAFLPLSVATAGASGGRTAVSFAVLGVANAWTTDKIGTSVLGVDTSSLVSIPAIKHVSCFGVLTAAYAEGVGACANILGTLDAKLDLQKSQLQLGLTNPAGLIDDPTSVFTELITSLLTTGNIPALSTLLTEDFGRLYLGGDELLGLTSDYGFSDSVDINWLGQKLTLFPKMTAANLEQRPNYLGLPTLTTGDLDLAAIIPAITAGPFKIPFLDSPLNPTSLTSTTSNTTTLASSKSSKSAATTLTAPVEEITTASTDTSDQESTEPTDTSSATTTTPRTTTSGSGLKTFTERQHELFGKGGTAAKNLESALDKLRKKKSKDSKSDDSTTSTGTDKSDTDSSTDSDSSSDGTGTDGTGTDGTKGSNNSGSNNSGSDNSGSDNSGSDNSGSDNSGSDNSGS